MNRFYKQKDSYINLYILYVIFFIFNSFLQQSFSKEKYRYMHFVDFKLKFLSNTANIYEKLYILYDEMYKTLYILFNVLCYFHIIMKHSWKNNPNKKYYSLYIILSYQKIEIVLEIIYI